MPNLSVQIGADTSKLVSGINQAKATIKDYIKAQDDASKSSGENSSVTKEQAQAYEKVINSLQKVAEGSLSTKQSQKELSNSVKELKEQWAALNNEARSSSFGQSMSETMSAAKAELQEMKNSMASVGNVKPNITMKRELRLTSNELIKLTAQYRAMSAAEKASAQGQELARKMDQIRAKAGEMKDTIGDVESEIKVMASDTPNLDVFNELIGVGADALSTYSSVIAMVTGDEKALKNAIATVMAVQSAANLVTKIANDLQSSSVIMLKVRKIQEGAAAAAISIKTAAEGRGTIATKAATVAQAAFNAVAKANPYVLLATAVLGLGAAIYAFTRKTNESTEAEKKAQEAAKAAEEEWKSFKETAASSGSTLLSTYSKLKTEWSNLKSEHEKTKWIEDNKEAFKKLGVVINNVGDAENFLETQTSKVVEAFMLRAKAAAYAALAVEKYKDVIQKELEFDKQKVSAGDEVPKWYKPSSVTRDNNGRGNTANGGRFNVNDALNITSFTEKGSEEYNEKLRERIGLTGELTREIKGLTEAEVANQKKANSILKSAGIKSTSNTTTKNTQSNKSIVKPEFAKGSIAEMEAELSKLKDDYRKGWKVNMNKSQFLSEVNKLEDRIKKKKIELGLEPEIPEGSLQDLEDKINEKSHNLKLAIDDQTRRDLQKDIDDLLKKKNDIELSLKPTIGGFVVNDGELADIGDKINKEFSRYLEQKYDLIEFPPDPTSGLNKWRKKSEDILRGISFYSPEINLPTNNPFGNTETSVMDLMEYHRAVIDKLGDAYDNYMKRLKDTSKLTNEEAQVVRNYIERNAELITSVENVNAILAKKENGGTITDEDEQQIENFKILSKEIEGVNAAYEKLKATKAGFIPVTNEDISAINYYNKSTTSLELLTKEYKKAGEAAYEFNRKSMLSERRWEVFRSGIDTIGGLTSSLNSNAQAWAEINGEELSKGFKDTMAVIDATINSINMLVSAYEGINNIIKLFGEISEISAAKKVAANTTELASDEALIASQTANTQVKVANDTAENTSEIGKLGVKEASAIAGATASGASLPFPANLAAIAAGIAAVVAAFAMVFSAFAEGGIVGGGSHIGDKQMVRVNSGEMILNGQQQKRLFNLLNGAGSRNGYKIGEGGVVKFKIKGNNLYGVLNNHVSKQKRV